MAAGLALEALPLAVFRLAVVFFAAVLPAELEAARVLVVIDRCRLSDSDVVHTTDLFNLSF